MKTNILLALFALTSVGALVYRWHKWRNEIVPFEMGAWYDESYARIDPPVHVKAGVTYYFMRRVDGEPVLSSFTTEYTGKVMTVGVRRKDL